MDEIEITDFMLDFKEAVRHTWNSSFVGRADIQSSEVAQIFGSLENALFDLHVLSPNKLLRYRNNYRSRPLEWLLVRPRSGIGEYRIQFGDPGNVGTQKWHLPITLKPDDDHEFEFYDFFDWQHFSFIDLPFVRTRVTSLELQKNGGKFALLESRAVSFFCVQ